MNSILLFIIENVTLFIKTYTISQYTKSQRSNYAFQLCGFQTLPFSLELGNTSETEKFRCVETWKSCAKTWSAL